MLVPYVGAASERGAYDFYFESVRKGTATFDVDDDVALLESAPGFSAPSKVVLTIKGRRPLKFVYEPATGAPLECSLAPPSAKGLPYSPTHPYLLKLLLDRYDLAKRGPQELLATDLAKGIPRQLEAELFKTEARSIGGRTIELREWRFTSRPSPEAIVWTDSSNVPLEWWAPAVNYEAVKRGFESLRPGAKYEKSVSQVRFDVTVEKNVWVPMRDGVRLMADVYRPSRAGKFPVILQRSCYERSEFGNADGEFFAQRGYVYVTEHVRGRGGSEGDFHPCHHEDVDGYDTISWCGTQPWSNGRVGMVGASYNGFCEWMAAKTRPRWLKTMISVVPMPGSPHGETWDGGSQYFGDMLGWFGLLRDRTKVQAFNDDVTAAMNTLPISKADEVLFGHDVPEYDELIRPDRFDASVREASYFYDLGKIDLPILYFDGWLDPVAISTKLNYSALMARHVPNQKLIWGPWNHFTNRESSDGKLDFTPDGYVDMRTITLRWFDRWLKLLDNGIDREPSVDEFILGENRWYHSNVWPPKNMRETAWYLGGHGRLTNRREPGKGTSKYTYDPATCVYSNAAPTSYFFAKGDSATELCRKTDQILFDSKPLKRSMRLDGPITGKLYAASDAKDTDWVMALLDVDPRGNAVCLASGMVRARYRKSFEHPEPLRRGEIFGYDIDLWQMGITIQTGHRLRVVVCSTLFPDKDRNLNTGEPIADATRMVVAHQTIYHDGRYPSCIELPFVDGLPN